MILFIKLPTKKEINMKYNPGDIVPQSGIYGQYSSTNIKENEVTCVRGERFPPAPRPNMYYKLVRATR